MNSKRFTFSEMGDFPRITTEIDDVRLKEGMNRVCIFYIFKIGFGNACNMCKVNVDSVQNF